MCVIIVASAGVDVPEATIDLATAKNPHGWGMTIKHPERGILVRRGMSARSARRAWKRAGTEYERVFHARIATGGEKDFANTHPFEITNPHNSDRRMLFHNGTVSMPDLFPQFCDSWHLAQLLKLCSWEQVEKNLNSYAVAERSRFVVVSSDPAKTTWMMGSGWTEKDGAHYSNTLLFPTPARSWPAPTGVVNYGRYENYETQYGKWEHGVWIPRADLDKRAEASTETQHDDWNIQPWEKAKELFRGHRQHRKSQRDRLHGESSSMGERGTRITNLEEWEAAERVRLGLPEGTSISFDD